MKFCVAFIISVFLMAGGCGGKPVLLTKPAAVPLGLDLSGNWVVSGSTGSSQREARELSVHVFLEMGKTLKVTQTNSGLFLSFDRSVVEEYRFGENREISVGAISAARASGWEGRTYVIETLDEEGAKLIETYRLENDGSVLRRTIVIWHRDAKKIDLEQVLNRV
ncbi:MAG: hypothetical protein ACR2QT_06540 [Woeseiaceae bacterium]